MEKVGAMVFSMSRATGTGFRSLCSLRLKKQEEEVLKLQSRVTIKSILFNQN